MLAANCTIQAQDTQKIQLLLANKHKALLNHQQITNLEEALLKGTGKPVKVSIQCQEEVTNTPHQQEVASKNQAQEQLKQQLDQSPAVQALKEYFSASIESVRANTVQD